MTPARTRTSRVRHRPGTTPERAHRVHVGGAELRLRAPRSGLDLLRSDQTLRRDAERGEPPHWVELWPASIALARQVTAARCGASVGPGGGAAVWDLGCGLGLAGLAAARCGATVVLADRDPSALSWVEANAIALGVAERVTTRVFDWREDTVPGAACALLLLADVAYHWRHGAGLLRSVDAVLAAGGGVLCADPGRPTANDFFHELVSRGATVDTAVVRWEGESHTVRIAALGAVPARPDAQPHAQPHASEVGV